MDKKRCGWCVGDPLYEAYHDKQWGVPVRDDATLFEFLLLETFQAGLSWITILRKRENFRKAFDGFDYKGNAADRQLVAVGLARGPALAQAGIWSTGCCSLPTMT